MQFNVQFYSKTMMQIKINNVKVPKLKINLFVCLLV